MIKDFIIEGGDFLNNDGTGQISIYGDEFLDESFAIKHNLAGLLSMTNKGKDTNGSGFMVTLTDKCEVFDGKHVVFGRVVDGASMITVRKIENVQVGASGRPNLEVKISECGEL